MRDSSKPEAWARLKAHLGRKISAGLAGGRVAGWPDGVKKAEREPGPVEGDWARPLGP